MRTPVNDSFGDRTRDAASRSRPAFVTGQVATGFACHGFQAMIEMNLRQFVWDILFKPRSKPPTYFDGLI